MRARIAAALFAAWVSRAALAEEDTSRCAELVPRLEEKLRTSPEPAVLLWLAICQGQLGELEKASNAAVRFMALYPDHPAASRARDLLARIEAEQRQRRKKHPAKAVQPPPLAEAAAKPAPVESVAPRPVEPAAPPRVIAAAPATAPPPPAELTAEPDRVAPPPGALPPAANLHSPVPLQIVSAEERKWNRPAGLAAMAVGVLAGGAAVWQGILSRNSISDANRRAQANGGAYLQSDLSSISSAHTEARTANILFIAGGVLVASGLVLTFAF